MSERELRNEVKTLRERLLRTIRRLNNNLCTTTVAGDMEKRNLDPWNCRLSDVMLSTRKIMRVSVEMTDEEYDAVEPDRCCDDEDRNWNGGCNSCGDPCY